MGIALLTCGKNEEGERAKDALHPKRGITSPTSFMRARMFRAIHAESKRVKRIDSDARIGAPLSRHLEHRRTKAAGLKEALRTHVADHGG